VPLACCCGPESPPSFAPLVFGDFLRSELKAGYQQHADAR